MDKSEIIEIVKGIIAQQLGGGHEGGLGKGDIELSSSIVNDLGADSLDVVELTMTFEEKFNIEFPDKDAEKFQTVQGVADYIENALREKEKQAHEE